MDIDIVFYVSEIQLVVQTDNTLFPIQQLGPYRTDRIFPFIKPFVRPSVRKYETVHAEVSVVGKLSRIAAVMEHFLSVFRPAFIGGMVTPFPHKSAAESVIAVYLLHVVFNIPGAVAHGVYKFTLDEGLFLTRFCKICIDLLRGCVHMTFHIQHGFIFFMPFRLEMNAFIMKQPGGIIIFHPASRLFHIGSEAGFVAEGPENDAALVFITDHAALHSVQNGHFIGRILNEIAEGSFGAASVNGGRPMGFNIRFRNHIKTIFAAQLREPRRIGIMAGADGIDIGLLHDAQIKHGIHPGNHGPGIRAAVMPVYPFEFDRPVVDEHHAVFDVNRADSHPLDQDFFRGLYFQYVLIRLFRIPQDRGLHREGRFSVFNSAFPQKVVFIP